MSKRRAVFRNTPSIAIAPPPTNSPPSWNEKEGTSNEVPPPYNNSQLPSVIPQALPNAIPSVMPEVIPQTTPLDKPSESPPILTSISTSAAAMMGQLASTFEPSNEPHELWSFSNALVFIIIIVLVIWISAYGMSALVNIQHIKDDWANQRCSPLIMPFASFFGTNTKDNFEFCMGKIFTTHSQGYLGSMSGMFSGFTGLLQSIFDSMSSLRNVIASLGGGINVIFQEFTERISTFFFQLRTSAVRIKMLMGRLYATLFSVMYMGMSGITGMTSFTNTFLFSFLDTFCFPGETEVMVQENGVVRRVPIKDVKIGDILVPGNTRVTATFRFYSRGQAMVKLGPIVVSTNHYLKHNGKLIMAGDHPNAIPYGPWDSDEHLYCLNTTDHTIPMEYLTFMDYDETPEGDDQTLKWIEEKINAKKVPSSEHRSYADACFAIDETAKIRTERGLIAAKDIQIGERLTTGSEVVGLIRREVSEVCTLSNGVRITPATLYWDETEWKRLGQHQAYQKCDCQMVSFVVTPNSQIELENGIRVRDYMEVCSPDSEQYYSALLEKK
jgi:hypothetical protein